MKHTIYFMVLVGNLFFQSGCIFDRQDVELSVDQFKWGLIHEESTLNILYGDRAIFSGETIVAIIDMDSLLVVKGVDWRRYKILKKQKFPNSESNFYILRYSGYIQQPTQLSSPGVEGPFSYGELTKKYAALNIRDSKFKYW